MEDNKETKPSKHNKAGAYMISLRLWQHAKHLQRGGPDELPVLWNLTAL